MSIELILLIFLLFVVALWFAWRSYAHPAHHLARQAANMGWRAVGRARDEHGYKNVIMARDEREAIISFHEEKVMIKSYGENLSFPDFVAVERWLTVNEGCRQFSQSEIRRSKDWQREAGALLDQLTVQFDKFLISRISIDCIGNHLGLSEQIGHHLRVVSRKIAYISILLAVESLGNRSVESRVIEHLRVIFGGRVALDIEKSMKDVITAAEVRPLALKGAAAELVDCEKITDEVIECAEEEEEEEEEEEAYPLFPVYQMIERQAGLTAGPSLEEKDQVYKEIIEKMVGIARMKMTD